MILAETFNEDAANYDKWRPTYCQQLFGDIIEYANLKNGQIAVEIGIGTGQATRPFLELGCSVKAIELGKNLAAYSRNKFRDNCNLNIVNCSFEDYMCLDASVDIVYSATAFHWIPEAIGYSKIHRMLKDGGALALFWNRPSPEEPGGALDLRIQKIYKKYMPPGIKQSENDTERYRRIAGAIGKYGFRDIEVKLYHGTRSFSADDYVGLLRTYSDHIALNPDSKLVFEAAIKHAVRQSGDIIHLHDTMDLFLARK